MVSVDVGEASIADLHRLPGVVAVEIRGGRARLRSNDSDATVMALARDHRMPDRDRLRGGLPAGASA